MLKRMVFENLVHFKNKTIIYFTTHGNKSPTGKRKIESNVDASNELQNRNKNLKSECSDSSSEDTTVLDTVSHEVQDQSSKTNGLNIFVGANFCGKSTVFELIRRCMTEDINVSETNTFDSQKRAYTFCEFELHDKGKQFTCISGFIKKGQGEKIYKIFVYLNTTTGEEYLQWKHPGEDGVATEMHPFKGNKEVFPDSLFVENKTESTDGIQFILNKINESKASKENTQNKLTWQDIENKYVATFPLRGVGIVHWTRSTEIKNPNNYREACRRAEVISALLEDEAIDEKREKAIFQLITHPHVFTFRKNKNKENSLMSEAKLKDECSESKGKKNFLTEEIVVTRSNDLNKDAPLLKTSEGIIEAKTTSLLLAHKNYQTICLEDPDRGMHPQMVERLKTILYCEGWNKTIIVVTHNPHFIDTNTISHTHVFFRKEEKKGKEDMKSYICSVTNAGESQDLCNVFDTEILRSLLFATKILLVEGLSDREVVQSIFLKLSESQNENSIQDRNENQNDFSTYQIIPISGRDNADKVRSFCESIDLPCLCLLDVDKYVELRGGKILKFTKHFESISGLDKYDKFKGKEPKEFYEAETEFKEFSEKIEANHKTFVWKGDLEGAIQSQGKESNENIDGILHRKPGEMLKKVLKRRLTHAQKIEFATELLKVDEVKRFIAFLERH